MKILHNIIFPKYSVFAKEIELYLRPSSKVQLINRILSMDSYQKVDFDTFSNCFPVKKWVDFGQINTLFIGGSLFGTAVIEIVGVKVFQGAMQEEVLSEFLVGNCGADFEFCEELFGFSQYETLFVRVCSTDEKCQIKSLSFSTANNPKRQVRLAVCIIDEHPKNNLIIDEVYKMIANCDMDIEIVNLPFKDELEISAFIRSWREISPDRTHILSLSVNGLIDFESIFRVVRFFEMVFDERTDVVLTGLKHNHNIVDWYKDSICTFKMSAIGGSKDRHELNWSFCAFDKKIIDAFGLPLPLLLGLSNQEFQNRIYKEIVPLPGLYYEKCIKKLSLVEREYHWLKDSIIVELLGSKPNVSKIKQLVWDRFWLNLNTYNYVAAELNLCALDHIIKGVYKLNYDELNDLAMKLYWQESRFTKYVQNTNFIQSSAPLKLSTYNWLKPYFLPMQNVNTVYGNRKISDFIGRTKVFVVDENDVVEVVRIRRRKAKKLVIHAFNLVYKFVKNYRRIRLDLIKHRNIATTY